MTKKGISAYEIGLRKLADKPHSIGDLAEKLKRKGYDQSEIESAITQLQEEGLLDDRSYAENYIQNLISYRTFGYFGIRNKLLLKRIDKNLADELVQEMVTPKVEREIAQKFIEKPLNQRRSKQSLVQAMRQKGYRTDIIIKTTLKLK